MAEVFAACTAAGCAINAAGIVDAIMLLLYE
jgi:hypothetical protein